MRLAGLIALGIAAVCVATSDEAQALSNQVASHLSSSWISNCHDQDCLLTLDVPHGGPDRPAHLTISLEANQSTGVVKFVSFRLPRYAEKGKMFAIGFADSEKDGTGGWTVKIAPGATRVLEVRDCDDECVIRLPGGVIAANSETSELDVVKAMLEHRILMMFYFHGGERVKASTPLFALKEKYAAVIGGPSVGDHLDVGAPAEHR